MNLVLLTFQVDSEVVAVVAVVSEVAVVVEEEEAEEGLEVGVEGGSDYPSVDNGDFFKLKRQLSQSQSRWMEILITDLQ